MLVLSHLRVPVLVVLLSGVLVGVSRLVAPALSAPDPTAPPDQEHPAVTPDSPSGSGQGRNGKGNHPMRKACADDVKKFCSDVKAGEGRILQCLKRHGQDLSQGCSNVMQQRGKYRQ